MFGPYFDVGMTLYRVVVVLVVNELREYMKYGHFFLSYLPSWPAELSSV